jgi:hypothetical protein
MINAYVSEEAIHYVAAFLDRWQEKAPTSRSHVDAMNELRQISNKLLEHLEEPAKLSITRRRIQK